MPLHSSLWTMRSLSQLRPGTSSVGARIVQPLSPLRMESVENGTRARKNAHASVPSAKFTPAESHERQREQRAERGGGERADHHRPEEVDLAVGEQARGC